MKTAPAFPNGARGLLLALALVVLIAPAALAADGYLGVRIQDVDEALAAALDLDDDAGVLISEVVDDSPAEAAGLQRGDLILTINGREASDPEYFTRRVRRIDAGETATLELVRKGKPMTIVVTLGEAPENEFFGQAPRHIRMHGGDDALWLDDEGNDFAIRAPRAQVGRFGGAYLGVNVHALDENLGRYFGADQGVLVLGVNEDTAAEEAGLQTGDVILSVDGEEVDSTIELHEALADFKPGDEVEIAYMRDKKQETVKVELGESDDMVFIREFGEQNGLKEFHIQPAPHHPGALQYRMEVHDADDIHQELQRMREQLDRLEKELEAAEEGE